MRAAVSSTIGEKPSAPRGRSMASLLVRHPASTSESAGRRGPRMAGADRSAPPVLSEGTEGGLAGSMLGEFVTGLGAGDARDVRVRFEQVVRQHLHVPFARLRELPQG